MVFFQAVVIPVLLHWCATCTLTKHIEKRLDGNYKKMPRAILKKPWKQHTTKHQLYRYLPPISKTIKVWLTSHVGHCWRSKDELISDVLRWTPSHERAGVGWPTRTYLQQLCADTVWETCRKLWMVKTNGERERERESQWNPWKQHDIMMKIGNKLSNPSSSPVRGCLHLT